MNILPPPTNSIDEESNKTDRQREHAPKERQSNLELYRIIVMLLIVAHHYVVNSGLFDLLEKGPFTSTNACMLLLGAWGKTGINCFIMITGWFMCKSHFTLKKFVKLYLQLIFYAVIIYAIFCITGHETFHPIKALLKFNPIRSCNKGFTSCFLVFFLLVPFINILIQHLTKRQHAILVLVLLTIYSIFPYFSGFVLSFNYVSWFSVIYLVASYLRFYGAPIKISHKLWGILTIILIVLSAVTVIGIAWAWHNHYISSFNPYYFISDSNKIVALALGISSFMFFKDLRIPFSRFINIIGATTFGVLLIHANSDAMRQWLWKETVDTIGHYGDSILFTLGYAIISILIIFTVCSGIDWFRGKLIEPRLLKVIDKFILSKITPVK